MIPDESYENYHDGVRLEGHTDKWWNYRLVFNDVSDKHGERGIAVHEVYYRNGVPVSHESAPAQVSGDTRLDATVTYFRMAKAFTLPALVYTPSDRTKTEDLHAPRLREASEEEVWQLTKLKSER